jgi:hypothetical protein
MESAGQGSSSVIHFSCLHCRVSLTVDDSLAGVTGPCPSCGEAITAPHPAGPSKVEVRPRSAVRRDPGSPRVSGGKAQISTVPVQSDPWVEKRRSGSRTISPETGVSEAHRERAEVAAVAKMLVAGLVVLAIVLAVAWWLNSRLGSVGHLAA